MLFPQRWKVEREALLIHPTEVFRLLLENHLRSGILYSIKPRILLWVHAGCYLFQLGPCVRPKQRLVANSDIQLD